MAGSEPLAQQLAQVAAEPRVGAASLAIAAYHEHLAERVGSVRLSVLHQRLRDEQQLKVSWASFYRYARQHWPERLRPYHPAFTC